MTTIVTSGEAQTKGPLIFLRLKVGVAGELARVVHLSEADRSGQPIEDMWGVRVLCGLYLQPSTFDVLSGLAGMPCELCALNSPGPD